MRLPTTASFIQTTTRYPRAGIDHTVLKLSSINLLDIHTLALTCVHSISEEIIRRLHFRGDNWTITYFFSLVGFTNNVEQYVAGKQEQYPIYPQIHKLRSKHANGHNQANGCKANYTDAFNFHPFYQLGNMEPIHHDNNSFSYASTSRQIEE